MKIRTYIAKDMRQALRQVREEQGPDAVILSTRGVPGGVEVSAAIDARIDDTGLRPVLSGPFAVRQPDPPVPAMSAPVAAAVPAPVSAAVVADDIGLIESLPRAEIGAELRSMRHLLETQLAQLAWKDLAQRAPAQAELLKALAEIGLPQSVAGEIAAGVPAGLPFDEAQRRALALLSHRVQVTGDVLLEQGGRVALVGPTGVGKTTAIAKLAARWVLRHGSRDIALVSVDGYRFGAQEQLKVLGRLLGVEAFVLDDLAALPGLLARLPAHRMILVDTAGLSPRDPELAARAAEFAAVSAATGLRCTLVLSAAAQAGVIEEAQRRFAGFHPDSCLLTKVDEATSLGGTLAMLARSQLAVGYVCDGQRIPEDLAPARAHQLVARAVRLAREAGATAGEDLLTRSFGGIAHAIA